MSGFPRVGEDFGRFHISAQLGHGGMGIVFDAIQLGLDRRVALKVLSPQFAGLDEFRARFEREASVLAALDSPHIIQIFDFGEHDGCLFLATQLVAGGDLAARLQQGGALPLDDALLTASQVAAALADAHQHGIIHRDVKPSNVLLRAGDGPVHAYLCDFGIARDADSGLTQTGSVVGTFGYLAPERVLGQQATFASDQYAVGCLLVAALTGSAPYSGSQLEVSQAHVQAPIPQWPGNGPLETALNGIVRTVMAKDPSQRYPSMAALRDELTRLRDAQRIGLTPVARPTAQAEPETVMRTAARPITPPPATPHPVAAPVAPVTTPNRGRKRVAVALGAVAAFLVVGAGTFVLARGLASDSPDPGPTAPVRAEDSPLAAAPAETSSPTQTTRPSPTPPPTHRCWDGRKPAATLCSEPRGIKGLYWVYPTMRQGECVPADAYDGKLFARRCLTEIPGYGHVNIYYSAWPDMATMTDHYSGKNASGGVRQANLVKFPVKLVNGKHQASTMFARHPFSVTAASPRPGVTQAAINFVIQRPETDFR